ncbi:MAG TPA: RNA-binding transcriptional accessory protein [Candidatus Cryptobacteroides merdipullorum]|uniref:RNA-binding transcriptional accessory protein n=1 Tax=Candidatus Cryptobacteroides merdipullorum TaxID=2840771 RepID=A0A9D1KHM6_9BACT|nr:RNA-binding transcriptional accessory protein [Candidatus Cryptobacteroides merdipullorum]
MKEIYIKHIAGLLGVKDWQVENCVEMFADGDTIPFISRYRKEKTGGMDDAQVAEVRHWADVFDEMEKRKETVLKTISEAGALTDGLRARIGNCVSSTELEDIYLPWRPKRRTRATAAREKGLEPLADMLWNATAANPEHEAAKFVGDKVASAEDALAGARDIIAERFSETAGIREELRRVFRTRRIRSSVTKAGRENPEAAKYRSYFDFSFPVSRIPSHNLLAMLRAENEGYLNIEIDADPQRCAESVYRYWAHGRRIASKEAAEEVRAAGEDSYKRLLEPSISGEIIREAKQKADIESIRVFGENLRQLLLSPPVGQKRTMAIDPGFRNGCKIACLDEQGRLLHHTIIYPHPPQNDKIKAIMSVQQMLDKYRIEAVAIGNGTASRETAEFMKRIRLPEGCKVWTVSEDGASIYSASEIARREFPDEDVTVRGAVSIGRRLMDPLAELVKIDPKNLGIGQYQHDVDQNLLKEKLDNTVESCVNLVGVNLNTASPWLLAYVAGIGPSLAENIVATREKKGGFRSRAELMDVPRLGAKAFEQCAGFLRIREAENPLDNSAVHPESYGIVDRMAASLGVSTRELVGNAELCSKIHAGDFVTADAGLPTINDILKELAKPGLDPREQAADFSFSDDIHSIEDLKAGMELPGIVTNITNFGAFVDIGLHENGLIHVSKLGPRGTDPSKVLKLHQQIRVRVLDVDFDRRRIALGLLK